MRGLRGELIPPTGFRLLDGVWNRDVARALGEDGAAHGVRHPFGVTRLSVRRRHSAIDRTTPSTKAANVWELRIGFIEHAEEGADFVAAEHAARGRRP